MTARSRKLCRDARLLLLSVQDTYMREDKLRAAWDRLDADDSGYLDHDDFRKLCKNMFS